MREPETCMWEDKGKVTVYFHMTDATLFNPKCQLVFIMTREGKCKCGYLDYSEGCHTQKGFDINNTAGDPSNSEDCGMAKADDISFVTHSRVAGGCPDNCKGSLPPLRVIKRVDWEITQDDWRRNSGEIDNLPPQAERCEEAAQQRNSGINPLSCWIAACGGMNCNDNATHCGPTQADAMALVTDRILAEICKMVEEFATRLTDCGTGEYDFSMADINAANRKILNELDPAFRAEIGF